MLLLNSLVGHIYAVSFYPVSSHIRRPPLTLNPVYFLSSSSTSSSPTTRSYTTVSVYSYYRPSYYYYSYYYGGVIYVGAYYGYTNGSTNLTAIIVPCAIIGTLFLLIVLCVVVGKCTNRDCLGACACMFCCQCSDDTKLIPPNE